MPSIYIIAFCGLFPSSFSARDSL